MGGCFESEVGVISRLTRLACFFFRFLYKRSQREYLTNINLQSLEDIIGDLLSGSLTTHIRAQILGLCKVGIDSRVNLRSRGLLVEELKHERHTPQCSNGVGDALAHDVRRRPMTRLAHGETVSHVRRGDQTQGANERGGAIGENVSVQVGRDNDIVGFRVAEELVHHRVDNLLLDAD